MRHFSHFRPAGRRVPGGGDAGSLTPRCAATLTRCTRAVTSTETPPSPHHLHKLAFCSRLNSSPDEVSQRAVSQLAAMADCGAAMRRQQRRLRQFMRHESVSVAMALAEAHHHSSGLLTKKVVERREGSARRTAPYGATAFRSWPRETREPSTMP